MSNVAVSVEHVGKKYRLGASTQSYRTLRDSLHGMALAPVRSVARRIQGNPVEGAQGHRPEFWALKDVSFDVKHGDVLGIIGRNGAGKSTLLKLLSQITEPTRGRIRISGRVASLLEVGTGFHPELTGRENVFLNGAILGMPRTDIARKFDEIVAFAEVEQFIDTPVKHYSSGMYLRLAFAVAAHLEPEILVVDEVLAVGDLAFQKKCMGKMDNVAKEGRTVLFVSHNMAAISNLCPRSVLLNQGRVQAIGETKEVVELYATPPRSDDTYADLSPMRSSLGNGAAVGQAFWFEDASGQVVSRAMSGDALVACLAYTARDDKRIGRLTASIGFLDSYGAYVLLHRTNYTNQDLYNAPASGAICWHIPKLPLTGGRYSVQVYLEVNGEPAYLVDDAFLLSVEDGDYYGTGVKALASHCKVLTDGYWTSRDVTGMSITSPFPAESDSTEVSGSSLARR